MRRLAIALAVFLAFNGAAVSQQPPAPLPPAQPAFDPAQVEAAVREFYAAYWRAWEMQDVAALSTLIARDYTGTTYVPGFGVVTDDYKRALAAVEAFFKAVEGQQKAWSRNLLTTVVRGETEAVAAVRTGFVGAGSAQSEVSLEVLRKGADGQWRLVRRWSEKHVTVVRDQKPAEPPPVPQSGTPPPAD